MKTIVVIGRLCGLWLLAAASAPALAREPQDAGRLRAPVTVELASGRSFTAHVDRRTDRSRLWLRWSRDSAWLLRPIAWDRIRQVQVGPKTLTVEQFRALVEASRPDVIPLPAEGRSNRIVSRGETYPAGAEAEDLTTPETPATGPARQPRQAQRVQTLAIDVGVANWDDDVEVDGLVVEARPLDADGRVAAVDGTLEVDLIVQRWGVARRTQPFLQRGRWTQRVRARDFGPVGARYRLPFAAGGFHPEFDRESSPYAAVQAQLSVPGQGVFAATEGTVRIRPYSAVRDALEASTGKRFFPQERTGEGRR